MQTTDNNIRTSFIIIMWRIKINFEITTARYI